MVQQRSTAVITLARVGLEGWATAAAHDEARGVALRLQREKGVVRSEEGPGQFGLWQVVG